MSQSVSKQQSLGEKALGIVSWIVGGIVGVAVGRYAGINLLIPLFFTGAAWWLATKLVPEQKKLVIPAFAVQCGHGLWMSLGLVLLGTVNENALDVLLLAGGLAWLLTKPSPGPLYLLGVYQLFALPFNGYLFYGAEVGSTSHKALLVHIIWRALALFFMVEAFIKLRKADTEVIVAP